jgi:hypothetical protein
VKGLPPGVKKTRLYAAWTPACNARDETERGSGAGPRWTSVPADRNSGECRGRRHELHWTELKTPKEGRNAPLHPLAGEALREYRSRQTEERPAAPGLSE